MCCSAALLCLGINTLVFCQTCWSLDVMQVFAKVLGVVCGPPCASYGELPCIKKMTGQSMTSRNMLHSLREMTHSGTPFQVQAIEVMHAGKVYLLNVNGEMCPFVRNDVGPETYLPRAWLSLFASWLSLPARVPRLPSTSQAQAISKQ